MNIQVLIKVISIIRIYVQKWMIITRCWDWWVGTRSATCLHSIRHAYLTEVTRLSFDCCVNRTQNKARVISQIIWTGIIWSAWARPCKFIRNRYRNSWPLQKLINLYLFSIRSNSKYRRSRNYSLRKMEPHRDSEKLYQSE